MSDNKEITEISRKNENKIINELINLDVDEELIADFQFNFAEIDYSEHIWKLHLSLPKKYKGDTPKDKIKTAGKRLMSNSKGEFDFKLSFVSSNKEIEKQEQAEEKKKERVIKGNRILKRAREIKEVEKIENNVIIKGKVFSKDVIELKDNKGFLTIFAITDKTNSISFKIYETVEDHNQAGNLTSKINQGSWLKIKGNVVEDNYDSELVLRANHINKIEPFGIREDNAEEKRVELHLHTKMSAMDATAEVEDIIETADRFGHQAVAITDHGVVHAFPEAYELAQDKDLKVIYGMEGYMIDDGKPIIITPKDKGFDEETFVVFDLETTGFNPLNNQIIEIGAVKWKNGKMIDKYQTFVNPNEDLTNEIKDLTNIKQSDVENAPELKEVMNEFLDFIEGTTIVAHNLDFDLNFINAKLVELDKDRLKNSALDTLGLARSLVKDLKTFKLNKIADYFNIPFNNHHRALADSKATAKILDSLFSLAKKQDISNLKLVNELKKNIDYKKVHPYHINILAKNKKGLKNLYKLVSKAHTENFHRKPRILKSDLIKHREGLLLGSACEAGELYKSVLHGKKDSKLKEIAGFYDFLEVQPIKNNMHLINQREVRTELQLQEINEKIYQLGNELNIPVVATGDVHFTNPEDELLRQMLQQGQGFDDIKQPPLYFKNTNEMLEDFDYFSKEVQKEIVIDNPNKIANMVEELEIIPDKLFTPEIDNAEEKIKDIVYSKAKSIYGENLPEIVNERLDKELSAIIEHGYSVVYLISKKLVDKSLKDGYLVGSRGSVGSSLVATMMNITEVNPLKPHYYCNNCDYTDFDTDNLKATTGVDLPEKQCPKCSEQLIREGFEIPFEVFLGFEGDKVPDIDLNFSGEYQEKVHNYTEELFGEDYVYRAGTISTLASRTSYGFVKNYVDAIENIRNDYLVEGVYNKEFKKPEINRLVENMTGIKKTTGQHPGGMIVVPKDMNIHDFTPIQKPANDMSSNSFTTHFDFDAIHDNLLKLDILGHDDPTSLKMLEDLTGVNPIEIPLEDEETMKIFSSLKPLDIEEDLGIDLELGTLGVPEFNTEFVRGMLRETLPTTFAELIRISGLSHGSQVWINNAQDLIQADKADLSEVISVRDDIMNYLIDKGVKPNRAFWIMENVRHGKDLTTEEKKIMREKDVPEWYINSCDKIKYMFPKAHATAYVIMAFRIAYFKVHFPKEFYTVFFSSKAQHFESKIILQGKERIIKEINMIKDKESLSAKDKELLRVYNTAVEAYARGIDFKTLDPYKSKATKFVLDNDKIMPSFITIDGIGSGASEQVIEAREQNKEFLSIEDFGNKAGLNKNAIATLKELNVFEGWNEKNQLSLFE